MCSEEAVTSNHYCCVVRLAAPGVFGRTAVGASPRLTTPGVAVRQNTNPRTARAATTGLQTLDTQPTDADTAEANS